HSLALKSDGTVVGWNGALVPAGLSNVTAIAAGRNFSVVITTWPVITGPPQNLTVNGGASATFTVVAQGAGPLTYQWQKDGIDLAGATGASLTISSASATDVGEYVVR